MANPLEQLGKNIAKAREVAGFSTQTALAAAMGTKQGVVSLWESGKIDIPISTLYKIAEHCKTSPAALLDPAVPISESIEGRKLDTLSAILSLNSREDLETIFDALKPFLDRARKKSERRASGA